MDPWQAPALTRLVGPLGLIALTCAGLLALSSIGLGSLGPNGWTAVDGMKSAVVVLLSGLPVALAYMLGGIGLARPLVHLLCKPESPADESTANHHWLQLALGPLLMLFVSHAFGVLGLLSGSGSTPRIAAWSVVGLGLVLLLDQVLRGSLRPERWPIVRPAAILWAPGLAVLAVAAANAPGALWQSEAGAFDALSYHLQLPKEWAVGTRLWPVDHNVYSYLPNHMEAGFLHLGALMSGSGDPIERMLSGEGHWVTSCQILHALFAVCSALVLGRIAAQVARRFSIAEPACTALGIVAGAGVLCTPWFIVVSSLAYTEAGMLLGLSAAALIGIDLKIKTWARGLGVGLAVGLACGCKPTALLMGGPLAGILLLWVTPQRSSPSWRSWGSWRPWIIALACASAAGAVTLVPWLLRNHLASGNMLFPFAASWLGNGHWTDEQIARHALNHHAPASLGLIGRLGRLFSEPFGLRHEQWGVFLPMLLLSTMAAIAWARSRSMALLTLAGMAVHILAWMLLTHMQSRFLIHLLVPGTMLLAMAGSALLTWAGRGLDRPRVVGMASLVALALAPLAGGAWCIGQFLTERQGQPNILLVTGPGGMTGMPLDGWLQRAPDAERARTIENLGPWAFINLQIRPQDQSDRGVLLLGDSTPLYLLGATPMASNQGLATAADGFARPARSQIVYHTTWDRSPLASVMPLPDGTGVHPWSLHLRRALGVRYVLINYDELARLIVRDRYYDPAVTIQDIARWRLSPEARLRTVKAWREPGARLETGRELVEIMLPPQPPGNGSALRTSP